MAVIILAMGGTMLGAGKDRLDFKDYRIGAYSLKELLASIPEIEAHTTVFAEQLMNVASSELTAPDWIRLKEKVEECLNRPDIQGVVIIHGTNTLEETAYFLHLTVNSRKPVVLTGSQRPFSALSSDAGANLLNAVLVAASPHSQNQGVLVVLNDEINSAREVTKSNTYRLQAFQSGQIGLLGYVDADHTVQFYRTPTRKHTAASVFAKEKLEKLPEVAIVYSFAGSGDDLIRLIIDSGSYQGLVVAGSGAGIVSEREKEALRQAVNKGIAVVRSSRVGNGRVVDLKQYRGEGFISADNLSPQKARILLMLALTMGNNPEEIAAIFREY